MRSVPSVSYVSPKIPRFEHGCVGFDGRLDGTCPALGPAKESFFLSSVSGY